MNNKKIPYIGYFIIGMVFTMSGVVVMGVAEKFGVDSSIVGNGFSMIVFAHTISLPVNAKLINKIETTSYF